MSDTEGPGRNTRAARRRLGWAALALAVAATTAVVPPLVLPPAQPEASGSAPPGVQPSPDGGGAAALQTAPPPPTTIAVHAADDGNLRRGARIIECPSCDGGRRVGYIGGPNTLAIKVAGVPAAGERTLVVVYETEVPRTLKVAVNDGPAQSRTLSGAGDYLIPARTSLTVFVPAGTSWIRFFNDGGDAPDINRIELR